MTWKGMGLSASLAGVLALGSTALAQAGQQPTGTSDQATGTTTQPVPRSLQKDLEKLHAANNSEVETAQLAEKNAFSQDVKNFAQKMIDDHTSNDQGLQALAQKHDVDLVGSAYRSDEKNSQKNLQDLQGKTGTSFDKAYMSLMTKEHSKDMKEIDSAARTARREDQPEIASFLEQTYQMVSDHHTLAEQVKKIAENETNAEGQGTGMGTGSSIEPGGYQSSGSPAPPTPGLNRGNDQTSERPGGGGR